MRGRWPTSSAVLRWRVPRAGRMSARAAWCNRIVLAVEAAEGTDAMLARCAGLTLAWAGRRVGEAGQAGAGSLDRPATIGPNIIRGAIAAGLRGVAFEAGGTILAQRDEAIAAADAAGLFLLGLDPDAVSERGENT